MTEDTCSHPFEDLLCHSYEEYVKCNRCDARLTPKQVLQRARTALQAEETRLATQIARAEQRLARHD